MRISLYIFCLFFGALHAQKEDKAQKKALTSSKDLTWEGNKELAENNFVGAEAQYRKAISKSNENVAAPYNLGNAYYDKESYSEAFGRFKQAGEVAADKSDKHRAYHNMGNVFMKHKEYAKAVEAYKEALRNNPNDEETRYNLALAKEMLKKEQQQQKNDDSDKQQDQKDQKDKNQDQQDQGKEEDNKDKENKEDEKEDGEQGDQKQEENKKESGNEKQEQEKKPEPGDPQEEQRAPRPNQLSPQQIENLLEAMQNEEKKVQEKMDARKVKGIDIKNKKDW